MENLVLPYLFLREKVKLLSAGSVLLV